MVENRSRCRHSSVETWKLLSVGLSTSHWKACFCRMLIDRGTVMIWIHSGKKDLNPHTRQWEPHFVEIHIKHTIYTTVGRQYTERLKSSYLGLVMIFQLSLYTLLMFLFYKHHLLLLVLVFMERSPSLPMLVPRHMHHSCDHCETSHCMSTSQFIYPFRIGGHAGRFHSPTDIPTLLWPCSGSSSTLECTWRRGIADY